MHTTTVIITNAFVRLLRFAVVARAARIHTIVEKQQSISMTVMIMLAGELR